MPIRVIASLGLILLSVSAHGADLLHVFQHALSNDPVYKAAEAKWLAGQEDVPINRAALLPQVTASGSLDLVHTDQQQTGLIVSEFASGTLYSRNSEYKIALNQALFDYESWSKLNSAKASVKQAAAEFSQAAEDLIFRTAQAYFEVLKADAVLRADVAERKHLASELRQTRQRYKVGVDDVTKLDETRSRYETAVAQEITDRNVLAKRMEDLRAITGDRYTHLQGLGKHSILTSPQPQNIQQWVDLAARQNFEVKAQQFAMEAAKYNINSTSGERYPVVTFESDYTRGNESKTLAGGVFRSRVATVGVSVNFPIFQGGGVFAKTSQARYQYQRAGDLLDQAYRRAIRETRQAYLDIVSSLGNIKADWQAIQAARSALRSSRAAYKAGTRTFADVLDRQSEFYDASRQYVQERYNFLISTLRLKRAAGTLNVRDLRHIDVWLKKVFDVRARVIQSESDTSLDKSKRRKHSTAATHKQAHHQRFTIQIATSSSRQRAQAWIKRHHLGDHAWLKKIRGGYRVMYGRYKRASQARKALKHFPQHLKKNKPFVKSLSG